MTTWQSSRPFLKKGSYSCKIYYTRTIYRTRIHHTYNTYHTHTQILWALKFSFPRSLSENFPLHVRAEGTHVSITAMIKT